MFHGKTYKYWETKHRLVCLCMPEEGHEQRLYVMCEERAKSIIYFKAWYVLLA